MADLLKKRGEFIHCRHFPDLPPGYDDWKMQKSIYCKFQTATIRKAPAGDPKLQNKLQPARYGLVFCHRGYYERARRIVENSRFAIAWGFANDLFLHEVDCRFGSDSGNYSFLAHDLSPERVTSSKLQDWSELAYEQVHGTHLVSRRVDLDNIDFASTYLRAHEKVPSLRQAMRMDHRTPYGLQVDLREEDLAKAIVEFTDHFHKVKNPLVRSFISDTQFKRRNIILKGYNTKYASYYRLIGEAQDYSRKEYGRQFFPDQLFAAPNLTMVFYPEPLVELALQRKGMNNRASIKERWEFLSLEYLSKIARDQILSFVDIEIRESIYNFILEIVYSGLGLGYHGYPESTSPSSGTARRGQDKRRTGPANPLTGEPLDDSDLETLFESRVDRAMIDVSLELRRDYPNVVLSSCTRLPDVITPDGVKYGTRYDTGSLVRWPEGQRGLSRILRAIHGGLYPRSDLVVADDPAAEVAARTWIDQYSSLKRSELLKKPYYEWLAAEPKVHAAIRRLNNGEFLANKCEAYETGEDEAQKTERIQAAMNRMYEGTALGDDMEPPDSSSWQGEPRGEAVIDEKAAKQEAIGQQTACTRSNDPAGVHRKAARNTGKQDHQRLADQFEARERRERKEASKWKANTSTALSRWDRMKSAPKSVVQREHKKELLRIAERKSQQELQQAKERRERRSKRATSEEVVGEQHQHGDSSESKNYGQGHKEVWPEQFVQHRDLQEDREYFRRDSERRRPKL
ncbi:ankyrin repeat-containing domain [Penicillium waksmanii]|uniref:ankyrin repeat-containing domain n=1 Tax=Penicillium waksmanii TaxID=69791 RepID=UPI00254811BF|nr:ankyrin repeat-containing domain [Penicillium waksmanii]KAJ5965858.1 ankyrin repeat-containing domain [Penicillium waksmanii]